MSNFVQIKPIEDETEIRRLQALVADVVEKPGDFRPEWLSAHQWTVVPVDSADHFLDTDIVRLSRAFQHAGYSECLAVAVEFLDNTPLAYIVPTNEEGLKEFNEATWAFSFILIPEDRSCAVLCTKDDYYLVGGPLPFVAMVLETGIVEACAKFAAFAEKSPHPKMREVLRATAARYGCLEPVPTTRQLKPGP